MISKISIAQNTQVNTIFTLDVIKSFGLQIGSVRAEKKPPSFSEEKKS